MQRDHPQLFADVLHVHVGLADVPAEPIPILVAIGSVDDQQVLVFAEPVEVGVVDGAAGIRGNEGVLRLTHLQSTCAVGQHLQKKRLGPLPAHHESAHVRDIEKAAPASGGEVLANDAGFVLHRHVPAAEGNHLPLVCLVPIMQYRLTQLGFDFARHALYPILIPARLNPSHSK